MYYIALKQPKSVATGKRDQSGGCYKLKHHLILFMYIILIVNSHQEMG